MSSWRVARRYGFGAGHFRLAPHPRSVAPRPVAPKAGLRQWRDEWREAGLAASLRSSARVLTVLGLAALLLTAFLSGMEPIPDQSDLEVAWLAVPEPELLEELALSAPDVKSPSPVAPPPQPAVVALVEVPPPSPEPVAVLPKPPPPLPVLAEHVDLSPRPKLQERPVSPAAPTVPIAPKIARLAPAPAFEPLAPRAATAPPRPTSPRPVVSVVAVARPAEPNRQVVARPLRPVAPSVRSTTRTAPRVAAPVVTAAWTPAFDENARVDRLATAAVYDPRAAARSGPPPRLAVAAVFRGSSRASNASPAPALHRLRPQVSAAKHTARAEPDAELEGVPLSALAACMSDREEDSLKLEVLARVRQPVECSSAAGRYRFVETRNLNAFLMWIQRSPTRGMADRCDELRFAIECLDGAAASGESL